MGKIIKLPGGAELDCEEFSSLSYEEKYEKIKKVFRDVGEDPTVRGVLFNPHSGEKILIDDIIDTPQEKGLIDAVIKSIENQDISSTMVKKGEMRETLERIKNGEATEEEKQIQQMLESEMAENLEGQMVIQNVAAMVIQVARFVEKERHYTPTMGEFYIPLMSIFSLQALMDDSTLMHKYLNNPDVGDKVIDALGEDIMNTWKAKVESVPDNLSLAMALTRVIINLIGSVPVGPIDKIANLIESATGVDPTGSCDVEIVNGPRPKTVTPNVYTGTPKDADEEEEMRDILRDD